MVSLIQRIDTSHRDMVHDAQMDFYGKKLATCSSDRTVKIFNVTANGMYEPVDELTGHEGPVWQVAWAHPRFGSLLATCSYDRSVVIWQENATAVVKPGSGDKRYSKIYEHKLHEASVNAIEWAPVQHGLMLAAVSSDWSISLLTMQDSEGGDWQWSSYRIAKAHTTGVNCISWCPSTRPGGSAMLAPSVGERETKRLVSGGCDKVVVIWKEKESGEWEAEHRLEGHGDWVRDVAWAPNVGMQRHTIASCSQDRSVLIWRSDGPDLDSAKWTATMLRQFDDVVWTLDWSLVGGLLSVSVGDNNVTLWRERPDGQFYCISDSQQKNA